MAEKHQEQWDEYNQTHQKIQDTKKSQEFISKLPVEARQEALVKRKEQLTVIQKYYDLMKSKEAGIISQGKDFADQDNPDNIQMYLDAYNEYFDYLADQPDVTGVQIDAMVQNIDALEKLMNDQKLRQEAAQQVPEHLVKQFRPDDLEKIRTIFIGVVAQQIADLGGMVPESGFNQEKLNELWDQAAAVYKNDDDETAGNLRPHRPLIGPVRIIRASPGWTGHAKYKH